MKSNRTYNIIGTGAIGGYYGACLQKHGINVNFLLNNDYEYVKNNGLMIESSSTQGDFRLASVNAFNNVETMPKADVVVIALKTTDNHLLSHLLPPMIKDNTNILVLQTGLGIEEEIANIVGSQKVVRGIPWIYANKVAPGHICHFNGGKIILGQYNSHYKPSNPNQNLEQIRDDFELSGIEIELTSNLLEQIWQKSYFHIPGQSLCVILQSNAKIFMQNPDIQELVANIHSEILSIASACNCQIKTDMTLFISPTKKSKKPFIFSMKQDYQNKKSLEIETVLENPLKMAQKLGIETPCLKTIYQQLKFINAQNIS